MQDNDPQLRSARPDDLNFLAWIDIKDEGVSSTYMANWNDVDWARHRASIAGFIGAPDKIAIVAEAGPSRRVGGAYARMRNRHVEGDDPTSISLRLEASLFPADGRFCEMFQLWVDPSFRRRGLASRLKLAIEDEARRQGVRFICTGTETSNAGVIRLNEQMGYRIAKTGPVWDDIPRVSLVKDL
jgi:ribosomal protein S18 acetylase RimI-like enzyme